MDLLDYLIKDERDFIESLFSLLENKENKLGDELTSNMFNVKVDYEAGEVIIEDNCQFYCNDENDSVLKMSLKELANRLNRA